MQRLAAITLGVLLVQGACAQCVAPAAANAATAVTPAVVHNVSTQAQPAPRNGNGNNAELIKTAAAGTRDDAPPTVHATASRNRDGQDRPRRGGTAMLLAALALMSGIALRRFGAPRS